MPPLISPSVNLASPQASQAGPRGRAAEEPEGRSFGAMLDRSRTASGSRPAADAATETPATRRPAREGERKSELSAADVLALLAPLAAPIAAPIVGTPADARTVGGGGSASAAAGTAPPGVRPDGIASDASASTSSAADATLTAAAQAAGAEAAAMDPAPEAQAKDDAASAGHAAQAADATDPAPRTAPVPPAAEAALAAAPPAAPTAPSSFAPPMPGAKAATPGAGEAVAAAAAAPADTPKAAAVQAAAGAAPPIAAAAEPKAAEALEADGASGAPALLPLASALPAAADRAAATSNATPVLSVAPPVGSHEWGPAIGQQMIRMSASGHQVAELNLNPAGLGPLKVTLTMGDDQAQAMFVSAHEGVRKAVEAALPQLRTTLADQGISLGHTSVGAESRQPSPQGGFAEQNPGRSSGQPAYPGAGQGVATASAAAQPGPLARAARAANAGLDTFA
jgi:flagellar hook-length control protein FliK